MWQSMKLRMGLFLFPAKTNFRLPELLALLQQNHQKRILRNPHPRRLLPDKFVNPRRQPDLSRYRVIFHLTHTPFWVKIAAPELLRHTRRQAGFFQVILYNL